MKHKKYTEATITRALKKLSKGEGFKEVAKKSGINIHTLRYYDKKNCLGLNPAKVAASRALLSKKKTKTDFKLADLAKLISAQVIQDLRQLCAS